MVYIALGVKLSSQNYGRKAWRAIKSSVYYFETYYLNGLERTRVLPGTGVRLHFCNPLCGPLGNARPIKDVCDAVLLTNRLAPFAIVGQSVEALQDAGRHQSTIGIGSIPNYKWCCQSLASHIQ